MSGAGSTTADLVLAAAETLRAHSRSLSFSAPVAYVYHPLDYAWCGYHEYIRRYVRGAVGTLFVGMNPGPFGMAQTGVPFGDVEMVRDFLGIECAVHPPPRFHPKRVVAGFRCSRAEVSGKRLWGLFRDRFADPHAFLADHLVLNYCPLLFVEEGGRNRTPDKLPTEERTALEAMCDAHLRSVWHILRPRTVVGVGAFAAASARRALGASSEIRVERVLHPSPASPAANRGWAEQATDQLQRLGIWPAD